LALIISAVTLALVAIAVSITASPDMVGLSGCGLALIMTLIAVIDARYFIIPDSLNAVGLGLGLVHAAVRDQEATMWAVATALGRGVALAMLFLFIRTIYARARGRQGLGLGDVKLAAVAGAWLDWTMLPIFLELAVLMALGAYLVRSLVWGSPISLADRLPFGVFLAPAIWLCWMIDIVFLRLV
jgi:leader peptidase (prepilin peptidase)/N-methyltransferase